MKADQHIWRTWASSLHRWGIADWAATFLESAGPLTILGAQIVYISQPLLTNVFNLKHLDELAVLLEDKTQTRQFVAYLREEAHA